MYADAKFLFRHDITHGALVPISTAAAKFTEERFRASRALIYHDFENWATNPKTADNIFLIFEDRSWTYLQFYEQIGRVGNWLIQEYDIQRGEIVALNGGNSPEYRISGGCGLGRLGSGLVVLRCGGCRGFERQSAGRK